jgi:hypothetical protein
VLLPRISLEVFFVPGEAIDIALGVTHGAWIS